MRKLYSRVQDHETVLELWASSTKHPDSVFYFSEFKLSEYCSDYIQVYQWLLECASKLTWVFHARALVEFANEYFDTIWDNNL